MKIADLKQPYRRMAEYLVTQNYIQEACYLIYNFYKRGSIMDLFCNAIGKGEHPPITEEIKKHFPPNFDFSGEVEDERRYNFAFKNNMEEKYTQLAREGKFDNLPDTCEFSEPVEFVVWDDVISSEKNNHHTRLVIGKFKNKFIALTSTGYCSWNYAQLPTSKIDFSQFKSGDIVEVELFNEEKRIGWFDFTNNNHLYIRILQRKGNQICNGGSCAGTKIINKEKIKSITKIK